MTLNEVKSQDTSTAFTHQQHHTKAAEHLELAAKSHKDAAKLVGANEHKAAEVQSQIAHAHMVKAQDHVSEAAKKTSSLIK